MSKKTINMLFMVAFGIAYSFALFFAGNIWLLLSGLALSLMLVWASYAINSTLHQNSEISQQKPFVWPQEDIFDNSCY